MRAGSGVAAARTLSVVAFRVDEWQMLIWMVCCERSQTCVIAGYMEYVTIKSLPCPSELLKCSTSSGNFKIHGLL